MAKPEIFSLILTLLGVTLASKCPEPRKPHPTSCTVFYNCVNLPSGGYVWAPAKCTGGLVFQPYLRICVLPGDSWTCDILATDPPETTTDQTPELIDPTLTSYLAYGEDVPKFSEPMDSYYNADKYSGPTDDVQQTVTPYPLIEVTPANHHLNQVDGDIENIGVPIAIKHSEDNYLYRFVNGKQVLATPLNANGGELRDHLQRLTQLMERLVAFQSLGIPLDRQYQLTTTPSTTTTTQSTPQSGSSYQNDFNTASGDGQDSAVLKFLIKNYVLKPQADSDPEIQPLGTTAIHDEQATTVATDSLDVVLKSPDAADNIIVVSDNLDNHQYFTISKYKSVAHQLTTETVELIPCTSGIRLPNSTDCTKYYSCDPETAKIRQFSCPSNTAFNQYKRLCERAQYLVCTSDPTGPALRISPTTNRPKSLLALRDPLNPCQSIGKHGDPDSESHYYLCYSDESKSTDIKFQRMVCPTSLVFCQTKSLCTTRQRCKSF